MGHCGNCKTRSPAAVFGGFATKPTPLTLTMVHRDVEQPTAEIHVSPANPERLADPDSRPPQEPCEVRQVFAHRIRVGIQDGQPLPDLIGRQGPSREPFAALQVAHVPNWVGAQGDAWLVCSRLPRPG